MKTLSRARARKVYKTFTTTSSLFLQPIIFLVEILCDTRGRARRDFK